MTSEDRRVVSDLSMYVVACRHSSIHTHSLTLHKLSHALIINTLTNTHTHKYTHVHHTHVHSCTHVTLIHRLI